MGKKPTSAVSMRKSGPGCKHDMCAIMPMTTKANDLVYTT